MAKIIERFDSAIGLQTASERQRAVLLEKVLALIPRMPWLYAILIVNLGGVLVSLKGPVTLLHIVGTLLLLVVVGRLLHWRWLKNRAPSKIDSVFELRRVFLIGAAVCSTYCGWMFTLVAQAHGGDFTDLALMAGLAALGCTFALSPMPAAARLPLIILSLPFAVLLLSSGGIAHIGMGFTLLTLSAFAMRLIDIQNDTLTRLIHARLDVELEKGRAMSAEKSAIAERSLARTLADTDVLTGLANRRALLAAIEWYAMDGRGPIAVALFDLDGFKPINDTFGHATGDELLVEVGRRLSEMVGPAGLVARLGGDEFALLLYDISASATRELVAQAIDNISRPLEVDGRLVAVSACAGIACPQDGETDAMPLIRMADIALFTAKRKGRGRLEFFSESLEANVKRRAEIELALRSPGVDEQLDLVFQPILDLTTMEICSFEALARWRHCDLGWIAPAEFIPISEQISVVQPISEALLRRAAAEALRWPSRISLSFNVSAVHLCTDGSAARILDLIETQKLDPSRLQIEITETALLADFDAARRNLSALRDSGVRLVLDDFGAGYASISYLREMQFDAIKLDGSLLTAANGECSGAPLLKGVLDLCRAVGLPCIAEHIESEEQVTMLRGAGCRFGQGYWLARPVAAQNALQLANGEVVPLAPARALKKLAS